MHKLSVSTALFLILLINTLGAQMVSGCWAAPEKEVWQKSTTEKFEFKRENFEARITVYKAGDRENALWSSVIPGFSALFSQIILSEDGEMIVHVRGNHSVQKRSDPAVHLIRKDGAVATLPVSHFIDELSKPGVMLSASPSAMWLSSFGELTETTLSLTNADGDKKTVKLAEVEFVIPEKES